MTTKVFNLHDKNSRSVIYLQTKTSGPPKNIEWGLFFIYIEREGPYYLDYTNPCSLSWHIFKNS